MAAFPSSTTEGVWTFPFGLVFDKAILEPADLNYQLQIDTAQTFSTSNLIEVTKTSTSLVGFQEGDGVGKAFEVLLPKRTLDQDVTWYWRLRIRHSTYLSDWTDIRSLTVRQKENISQTAAIFSALADKNAYTKEGNSTNVYKMLLQVGRELDSLLWENDQSVFDLFLDGARDSALVNNFSTYLGMPRSGLDVAAHHRWKTRKLWKAFTNVPGTVQGMIDSVTAFVAEPPTILDLTTTLGWILDQNIIKVPTHPEISPIIVIYSRPQRGYSFILNIFNSWNLTYDENVLERFILRQKPSHTQMNLSYSAVRHWSVRYNLQADWALWGTDGNMDMTTNPGTLRLNAGATTSTITSPVVNIPTASGYDSPIITTFPAGQTITVEYRTSQDGVTFTSYVALQHGVNPDSSIAIGPYAQFRITLSRTSAGAPNPVLTFFEFQGTRS